MFMKKRLGLLMLASTAMLFTSCNRALLRKTAALLVATYTNFDTTKDDTYNMVKKAKISWNYKSTEPSAETEAIELVSKLTGTEHPEKSNSKVFDSSNCHYFFEVYNGRRKGHKIYYNDIIKWNLFTTGTSSAGLPIQVFDLYFAKVDNCQYSSRVNDLFVSGAIRNREDESDEGKKIGNGNYHYDSYGRLVEASIKINYAGHNGKVRVSLGVTASYNPIKD